MAKRMSETEKWKDPWFEGLSKDFKLIWLYLLDDCDNAGIWQMSIRRLNFNCDTNVTEENLLNTLSERLIRISKDRFIINKFNEFQYGTDFLEKKSKPVLSAIKKLKEYNLVEECNGNLTLTIPLPNTYLSTKDKAKEQEQDKFQDKYKEQEKAISKEVEQAFAEFN
jgi:hypothetical protein